MDLHMKSFEISDGDLSISKSKRVNLVQGREKLIQDLTLWLLEPLGIGFTTPSFGSTLNTVAPRDDVGRGQGRFVGRSFTEDRALEVEAEIDRILHLYQQNQIQRIKNAQAQGTLYTFSRKEILDSIDSLTSN